MNSSSETTVHGTFEIEREFDARPIRVFQAWSKPETKGQWFVGLPDRWVRSAYELDFRTGGREILEARFERTVTRYEARIHEIVDGRRIVYAYDMHVGGVHLSVSLATVELSPKGAGTHMRYTEQIAVLTGDTDEVASRKGGVAVQLDRLKENAENGPQ